MEDKTSVPQNLTTGADAPIELEDQAKLLQEAIINLDPNWEPAVEKLPKVDIEHLKDFDVLKKEMRNDLLRVQNCHLPDNKYAVLDFDHKYLCNESL